MITDYKWIDDNSELEQLILSINPTDTVAFDSEFERVNTYYPKPALFQLKIKHSYYLIDMKEVSNLQVFTKLLNNIILHSGSEDLEILNNFNGVLPDRVFDTQIAASLCGYGLHFSYQNIVKELLGIELSKAHSRSNWMKRPLSNAQLQYALEDVAHLHELKSILSAQLEKLGRLSWFKLLTKQRLSAIMNGNHVNKTFIKIAKSKSLNESQQKLLFSILSWREKLAAHRDKPRQWILKNDEIINIIIKKPQSKKELISKIGLYPKFVKYNAESILNLYSVAQDLGPEKLPQFKKLTAKQGLKYTKIKQELDHICEKFNIPPALIINVTDLKSLIAEGKELSDIDMWQLISH